jgi:hypothetical protein
MVQVWKAVERRLIDLADNFALPEDRHNFIFRAINATSSRTSTMTGRAPVSDTAKAVDLKRNSVSTSAMMR